MERLEGRIAVVTGGGAGMGRELVLQLADHGCDVATCDLDETALEETRARALEGSVPNARVVTFRADVSSEDELLAFRKRISEELDTDHINLLFNNAGLAGGGSFVRDDRGEWEKTFAVNWGGVYLTTRVFLPMLMAADEGHVVNTSSINGVWASIGPKTPHTAYCTTKFAVRGFTEALITDFRMNAPHLKASVVMPGHVGTSIVLNSAKLHGRDPDTLDAKGMLELREQLSAGGMSLEGVSDDDIRRGFKAMGEGFRDSAPVSAASAAETILEGVKRDRWRILVGDDAVAIDAKVRAEPEKAYDLEFWKELRAEGIFRAFG